MKTVSKSASNLAALLLATAAVAAPNTGSLWPAGTGVERGMTADRMASRTGDILTIVVAESASATSAQTKSASRESSLADSITQFIYTNALAHNGQLPTSTAAGKSTYSGGGSVNNSQTLTARAAVLVTDVLPNGNLVIEGARMVTFSGETQHVILHGLVRPADIGADNTVLSTNIAEARVEFVSDGTLTEAQKRGWLSKLYEKLRPF
jgi:flagellar L-ring protein precursor FlgH